ncbi:MAG: hypothetical protein IH905_15410 [Proteobacteria bacterium]|nr:hypothetical protein [Pseudomonadota bacterium]
MTNTALLWIVTALYAGQVGVSIWYGQSAHAVIVGGYTIANLGLIWSMVR